LFRFVHLAKWVKVIVINFAVISVVYWIGSPARSWIQPIDQAILSATILTVVEISAVILMPGP
jgi:hypothetical protein